MSALGEHRLSPPDTDILMQQLSFEQLLRGAVSLAALAPQQTPGGSAAGPAAASAQKEAFLL